MLYTVWHYCILYAVWYSNSVQVPHDVLQKSQALDDKLRKLSHDLRDEVYDYSNDAAGYEGTSSCCCHDTDMMLPPSCCTVNMPSYCPDNGAGDDDENSRDLLTRLNALNTEAKNWRQSEQEFVNSVDARPETRTSKKTGLKRKRRCDSNLNSAKHKTQQTRQHKSPHKAKGPVEVCIQLYTNTWGG